MIHLHSPSDLRDRYAYREQRPDKVDDHDWVHGEIVANVELIRAYGWRGGCPATGVTDAGVGSGDWLAARKYRTRRSDAMSSL